MKESEILELLLRNNLIGTKLIGIGNQCTEDCQGQIPGLECHGVPR